MYVCVDRHACVVCVYTQVVTQLEAMRLYIEDITCILNEYFLALKDKAGRLLKSNMAYPTLPSVTLGKSLPPLYFSVFPL